MSTDHPIIGVLALQGAVEPHRAHLEAAGAQFRAVKTPGQFAECDGMILPGGESTTMLKLIDTFNLWDDLVRFFNQKPVWGICAGSILMAQDVHYSLDSAADPKGHLQKSFGLLPLTVARNGYGRQIDSHHTAINGYEVSLIRAPVFTQIGAGIDVLASYEGRPIWIKQGNKMASSFHPELTLEFPSPMHTAFVDLVRQSA